jgi:hypothetical protein
MAAKKTRENMTLTEHMSQLKDEQKSDSTRVAASHTKDPKPKIQTKDRRRNTAKLNFMSFIK